MTESSLFQLCMALASVKADLQLKLRITECLLCIAGWTAALWCQYCLCRSICHAFYRPRRDMSALCMRQETRLSLRTMPRALKQSDETPALQSAR